MAGASSSSSSGGSWKYDVFINFRGEDTRRCFVCHLYEALKQKTLDTFIDSEELRKGDDLSELLKAIQNSRLSILVFSKNYASSTWCLKELVQTLECMESQKQIVVPIFYEVDPSDVRKQRGSFAEAFAKYASDSNVDMEELESWKSSLIRASNLSGWDSKNYQDDIKLIKDIVEDILKRLIHISRFSPSEPDGLVGMDSHINEIDLLLQLRADDFRIVGIWGMGGIGKSTIAKAVYDKIAHQFEHSCFLDNVKEGFLTKNGGAKVTEELLSKILKVNDRHILDGGLNMIRERLGKKKVLLVLDDVDNLNQIETLIGKKPSFGGGSRIIITSRDKHLLAGYVIYEPKSFTDDKALELFRQYAFRTNPPSGNYDDLSMRAIKYAHGLPLALKVLGAFLDNKSVPEWEDELEKIKKIPNTGIQGVLRTSFDGLDDSQKNIFLDIACFFRGYDKEDATELLDSFGFFPHSGLRVLVDRALVTISYYDKLEMHDLIQEMGWDIVNGDPRGPCRLWRYEDVHRVLSQNTNTGAVEGIVLNLWMLKELYINTEAFVSMKKLRLLQLGYDNHDNIDRFEQHMSGDLKFLSCELRVLVWHGCPIKSLPSNFDPKNLVHLEMPYSHIEQLWEGTKPLQNLVHIDLRGSQYLIKTPDLTLATNLEELDLEGCVSLVEIHPSILALKNLACLDLKGCKGLKKFPNFIDMKFLQSLDLRGCSNLEKFRLEFSEDMKELKHLLLDETAITEITSSINNHPRLQTLGLRGCRELRSLPSSIHLESLEEQLDLSGCSNLEEFPEISGDMNMLSRLNLDETAIKELPSSIEFLQGLKTLTMSNCRSLVFLPDNICKLACLEELYLDGCSKLSNLPENLGDLKHLSYLRVERSGIQQLPFSISRLSELELLSSWPTWIQENPSYSALEYLDLSDCNLLELSDGIAHLSSLRSLRLCRNNNLESLPAAMNRLIQLSELYLEGCKRLKSIPELSSSIRFIDAHDCTALKTVSTRKHPSFEKFSTCFRFYFCLRRMQTNQMRVQLQKFSGLQTLGLYDCRELRNLPSSIHLESLALQLDLSGCSNLEEFPEISGYMNMLSRLKLDGTAIKELPSSIEFLQGLCTLTMSNCRSLVFLPDNICKLACLEELYLDGCSKLSNLPENLGDLEDLSYLRVEGSGIQQLPLSIARLNLLEYGSLSCKGCKEMTAPFSSWPTWIQENPTYSVLAELDLSDCNLLDLSDGIAHLSSLESLKLCRNNNLESLPAAMNRLIRLTWLYLEGCKRLKSIPELSSSIKFIDAHDCTALKTVSTPKPPYFEEFSTCFRFYNCFQLVQTNLFTDIVETAADNQAYYHPVSLFPAGSDIPDWFNHRCRGSSVTVQLPPNWLANKFVGLAICAISNLRGADNSQTLRSAICWCTFKANDGDEESFHFPLVDDLGETDRLLESDHMFLRYENSSSLGEWHNKGKYTEARFRIVTGDNGVIPNDSMTLEDCTWITSCGVCLFDANNEFSFSKDLCDLERSNRKRVTVKKKKERKRVPPLQNDSISLQNKSTASCVYDFSKRSNRKRVTVKKKKERERVPPFHNYSMSLQNKSTASRVYDFSMVAASRVYDFSKVAEALAIMDKEALDSLPFSQRRKDFS